MAMATPMKSRYVPKLMGTRPLSSRNSWYSPYAIAHPSPNGRAMPAAPTLSAILQFLTRRRKSTSSPTRKRKRIRPTLAAVESVGIEAVGKMALVKPGTRPRTEGPSSMPPMTSAMTRGCLILERGRWRSRVNTTMMPACRFTGSALGPAVCKEYNLSWPSRLTPRD